ncbi:MAG: hypothetical protein BWZ02_00910 [Lentisphaerae bacterium ADurb.BinA184]|nr:MAG: hypothetical protein BWZ02_00910 [Lentisphaerae bacterium ADurb.BinA184]
MKTSAGALTIALAILAATGARAQSGGYGLAAGVIAGGGTGRNAHGAGGGFELSGTVGQPLAGPAGGNGSTLDAGFWTRDDIFTCRLALAPEWNLISVPLRPLDARVETLLPDTGAEAAWEWLDDFYLPAAEMRPGRGYWLHCPAAAELVFRGLKLANATVPLRTGWNLVGPIVGPPYPETPLPLDTEPAGTVIEPAYAWDPVLQGYRQVGDLTAGDGHWIFSAADAAWPMP